MHSDVTIVPQPQEATTRQSLSLLGLRLFAVATITIQLALLLVFWPIPNIGARADPVTGIIQEVTPASPSERAGLRLGDRIDRMYWYRWNEGTQQLLLYPVTWYPARIVPMQIERDGQLLDLQIITDLPTWDFQAEKLSIFVLSLICWVTGVLISLIRRHHTVGTQLVGWFWIAVGCLISLDFFARYSSYPLAVIVQWLLLSVISPTATAMHFWFPPRPIIEKQRHIVRHILIAAILCLNILGLATVLFWQPSLIDLLDILSIAMPAALTLSFIGSGIVLGRAYLHTSIAMVRRQIRMLVFVCFLIAFIWIGLRTIPLLLGDNTLLPGFVLDLLAALVPLAYLVGSYAPRLYRIDRIVRWLTGHALTALLAGSLAFVGTTLFGLSGIMRIAWMALGFIIFYQPIRQIGSRIIPRQWQTTDQYLALTNATRQLATTLNREELTSILFQALNASFGEPPLALYLKDVDHDQRFTLVRGQRLALAEEIVDRGLIAHLRQLPTISESQAVYAALNTTELNPESHQLLHQPGIALWCVLQTASSGLLGVLFIGMRADLDPYTSEDLAKLQTFLQTSALAFANSHAYLESVEAEATIRNLYHHVQRIEDETAAEIAREIHDEIINVLVRVNVELIEELLSKVTDPAVRTELETILEGTRMTGVTLREVCERLDPTGIDDAFGLAGVLRAQVEYTQSDWHGRFVFESAGKAVAVPAVIQREAIRLLREALTNAMKHANASKVRILLRYPEQIAEHVQLIISDNGQRYATIRPRIGAWGVRNMIESARGVGGTLEFQTNPTGGADVVFSFPTAVKE